jgi:hypothetical protein
MDIQARITTLAKHIVKDQVDEELRSCYNALSDENKARVFEAMAAERGLLVELRRETETDKLSLHESGAQLAAGVSWQQLIERIPFSAIGKTLRSVINSYQDPYCDGSDPDVDYTFVVAFPYAVTNPDSLRSFAGVTAVDAMLTYYQIVYGGINGRGRTDSGQVYLCIGDTGVANAGGEQAVRDNLKLHDNN